MSFDKLEEPELRKIATEEYGLDVDATHDKNGIIAALDLEGITFEDYKAFKDASGKPLDEVEDVVEDVKKTTKVVKAKAEKAQPAETMVVKMQRQNFSYQTNGVSFTKEDPFALVSKDIAQKIFDSEEGFVPATPREIEEFYK